MEDSGKIRQYSSGATRDTDVGKLSYVKALSPIVLQRYVQYLDAHRKQSDGSMREFDNWKNGIPEDTYLDGIGRHFVAAWLLAQGYPASDNHGPVNLQDTLCAIIFGASGWLHEILKKEKKFVCPEGWEIELNSKLGWYVYNQQYDSFLWKDLATHFQSTGYIKFQGEYHRHPTHGEAPGYWPTKEAAEAALTAYLEK